MKISNNGKYWIVQDASGNKIALFKSIKSLTDYVYVVTHTAKIRNVV